MAESRSESGIRLEGADLDDVYDQLVAVATGTGYTVTDADDLLVLGQCDFATHAIRMLVSNAPVQRVKTPAHELGHAFLHEDCKTNLAVAELEAEQVSVAVCDALGIDTSAISRVDEWAEGLRVVGPVVGADSAVVVAQVATTIIDQLTAATDTAA